MSLEEIRLAILNAEDRELVAVEVTEWKRTVYVRPMSGLERDAFEAETLKLPNRMANFRARMVARVACDKDGERLFKDSDAEALGAKAANALDRIFTVAQGLNRLGREEVDVAKKDSASSQSDASGSGSPSPSA